MAAVVREGGEVPTATRGSGHASRSPQADGAHREDAEDLGP